MSLHLIESRVPSRAIALRRPGANAVSFAMHATLVGLAVIATSAPPTFARETTKPRERTVYVQPPKPAVQKPIAVNRPVASQSQAPVLQMPALVAPINIPTTIADVPPINTDMPLMLDLRHPGNPSTGAPNGIPGGMTSGNTNASGVFDEPQVDRPVVLLPGMPTPRYPESLRAAGVQDSVVVAFVVDAQGRVENGSLQFPSSTLAPFSNAIRESLMRAKYRPAEAGGHAVRQRVEQAFIFSLNR